MLQWLLAGPAVPAPPPKPEPPTVATGSSDIETLLQNLLPGNLAPATRPRPMRRDWAMVVCFSCGKAGHMKHSSLCCRNGKVGGGYAMISPCVSAERRRAGNDD